ncbi:MAG TPA: DUF4157 domain-containing protein, partial [Anaerolineae bacterium]|nr:DUF4157 domain-containing protein [Anaerolineae bacterium]
MAHHSSQRPIVQRISRKSRVNRSVMRAFRASQSSLGLQRGVSKPAEAAPETIVALQRTYGNRAVQRLTHDQLSEGGALDAPTSAAIERSQGGGQPLANAVRQPLEQAFQSDFSQVRVHADPQADRFNRSVQAEAFTLGHDIYFRKDNYAPSTTTGKKLIAHELTHVVQQTGQPAPAVQRAPAATATLPAPEELTSRIAHCIGIWETNRGKDDPAPRESSLDTVSGLHASMATIEQATMPYAITALKNHQTLRNKATPPLTLVELNAAEARCTAVVTLLSSVNTASAAGTTPDDFIKGHADAITATGLSNDDVKTMFSAVELKKTIDAAHARVEAETTDAAKKKKLEEETAAIPESDRLGLGTGSVKAYIRNTKNWGENRAAWQRKAVNAMPDNVGTRIQQVAVSDNGTALAIPVVRSRVDAQLAKTPVPSEEEIVKTVAQQNNPNETNYGQHVWETYTKHTWGTTATAQSSTSSAAPTEKSPETKTSSATPEKQTASSGNTTATTTTPSYAANASQYFNVANQITSIMEGGSTKGSYGALTTINDGGIISYGKHQATLSSGSLGSILNAYIASAASANAEVIRKNITRVNQKDITLKDDKTFLEALRGAAGEKEMQVAQDLIFSQGYWDPAVKAAQKGSIQSPLGFAMLYDTKIQGGMEACMKKANEKCKGNIGAKVEGKAVTELDFLKAFNDAREERLEAIAVAAEAAG